MEKLVWIVTRVSYEYDDEYYYTDGSVDNLEKAFSTFVDAEEYRKRLTIRFVENLDEYYLSLYDCNESLSFDPGWTVEEKVKYLESYGFVFYKVVGVEVG